MKIEKNNVYNCDCIKGLDLMIEQGMLVDTVLTSPPYNTMRNGRDDVGYDEYQDGIDNQQYIDWTIEIFNRLDKVLVPDGKILYNMSYGSENTECMNLTIAEIIRKTNFTIADIIVWEKTNAQPNNVSHNKLTRICEFVYVFCRKNEINTFHTNKQVIGESKSGQRIYENVFNKIYAKNNDGSCDLNKATFSIEFCFKLMNIYCKDNEVVLDIFMGTGTTAVACHKRGLKYIGFELSKAQCDYANNRLNKLKQQITMFD